MFQFIDSAIIGTFQTSATITFHRSITSVGNGQTVVFQGSKMSGVIQGPGPGPVPRSRIQGPGTGLIIQDTEPRPGPRAHNPGFRAQPCAELPAKPESVCLLTESHLTHICGYLIGMSRSSVVR